MKDFSYIRFFKSFMTDIQHIQSLLVGPHCLYEGHLQILFDYFCPSQQYFSKILHFRNSTESPFLQLVKSFS